ncbi:MAG TPA: pilus assembly PilX N-terminal domain-containing protein [Candidatus Saccharimonadales bacterium]|nr:pilus assembly PilX N-terminal domain-containing protein [Candidatus Saccharimonadales bacterium]
MIHRYRSNDKAAGGSQDGYLLVTVLAISVIFGVIGLALMSSASSQFRLSSDDYYANDALYVAEAGIEQSVHQLNQDSTFTGYGTAQQFFNNSTQGTGTFTTTVANIPSSNAKTITSVGRTYRYGSSTVVSTKTIKVTVVGTQSNGSSVVTGPGGLILTGSATITNGPVYVNGSINLSGAAAIGTNQQPLSVNVADEMCPTGANPGPTYPQVCTSGNPITMAYSTHIYGTVCATNQTSTGPNNNITGGSTGQGLVAGCVAPVVAPPTYDRASQIAAVTTTAAGNNINYDCSQWQNPNGFTRTWPANLELTGNVNMTSSCNLTITGNVYITGNLTIGGAATIRVADSVGTTQPVIVVDGTITVNGSASMIANSSGTGIKLISFKSSASCGSACTSLSGNDLYNSQSQTTVNIGGAVNLPGMVFQSYWGTLALGGSGHVGAIAGQVINMSGAGTVIFGTTLSSGTQTWTITSYQQPNG